MSETAVTEETIATTEEPVAVAAPIFTRRPLSEANWYVIKVQPEREDRIKSLLEEQIRNRGLREIIHEILIPLGKEEEFRKGKKEVSTLKTFPGYLFIEMSVTDEMKVPDEVMILISEISGISGFVSSDPTHPEKLPVDEISRILRSIDEQQEKPRAKIEFEIGQSVRIKEGPFVNFVGEVEEIYAEKGMVKINVHIFGRITPLELEFYQVEKVK